ncbi:MAG: c-type cytochrome [Deinococcales bacterium]
MLKSRFLVVVCAVVALVLSLTFAQNGSKPTVRADVAPRYGLHLTDANGMSLYLLTRDAQGASTCTGDCATNWPPLIVKGTPVAGKGVDASLLGTVKRSDGSLQVTYNGWPLYTYIRDHKVGEVNGEGLGNLFWIIDPSGKEITKEQPEKKVQISKTEMDSLMAQGKAIFDSICHVCHGDNGEGKIGPALDGDPNVGSTFFIVNRVLNGFTDHGMPSFRDQFTDQQVAAITTYVRNSWSNDYGAVTPEEVKNLR